MPGLRISGYLPDPTVNGGGDRLGKVQFSELQKPRDLDLELGSGHTAYRRASLIYLPNFIEIGKTFCGRTDGRMDGRTYVGLYVYVPTDVYFRPL